LSTNEINARFALFALEFFYTGHVYTVRPDLKCRPFPTYSWSSPKHLHRNPMRPIL